jgi:mannose-6-phosphate isomerase-like protein (cupin superfamily)
MAAHERLVFARLNRQAGAMRESDAFNLLSTFVHLERGTSGHARASALPLTRRFWRELRSGKRRIDGRLMGVVGDARDSDHWEAHPAGDEFLCRLSGEMEVVLEGRSRRRVVKLGARNSCCIVPRGVWHTLLVRKPGALLFVTPGKGTQVRPAAA